MVVVTSLILKIKQIIPMRMHKTFDNTINIATYNSFLFLFYAWN